MIMLCGRDVFSRYAITKSAAILSPTFTLTVSTVPAACQMSTAVCLARTVPVAPMVAVRLPRSTGAVWNSLAGSAFALRTKMNADTMMIVISRPINRFRYFFKNGRIVSSARGCLACLKILPYELILIPYNYELTMNFGDGEE